MRHTTALLTTVSVLVPIACWAQQAPTVDQMQKFWQIKPTDQRAHNRGLSDDNDDDAGTVGNTASGVAAARPPAAPRTATPAHVASAKAPEAPAASGAGPSAPPAQKQATTVVASGSDAANPCSEATGACAFYLPFPSGSAELTPAVKSLLDPFGQVLMNPNAAPMRFKIEGHTDTVGSRDFNQTLSLQRAKAVVEYLAAHYGIDPSHLVPDGKGKDNLPVPTPDQTPKQENRVVQVFRINA